MGSGVSDSLAQRLFDGSEGNPFFTKELVRSLTDSNGMSRDDSGVWTLSAGASLTADVLPATIQEAVEKRIERLPDDLRDVLSTAAVLGRSFDARNLEALVKGIDVDDAIDRLVEQGLIEEERDSRGGLLSFSSGVVRDVLYAGLSPRKRRTLHRRCAELLESRHVGRLERVLPHLVDHCFQGDMPEKTVEYALRLAQASLDAFSPDEATRAAKAALTFLDEEWAGDRLLEGEARLQLARALRMAGDVEGALRESAAAARVYEQQGQAARGVGALVLAAEAAWQARRTDEASRWIEKGLAGTRAAGDAAGLHRLLSLGATVAGLLGEQERATAYLHEAARLEGTPKGIGARRRATGRPPGGRAGQSDEGRRANRHPDRRRHRSARQRLRDAARDRHAGTRRSGALYDLGDARRRAAIPAAVCPGCAVPGRPAAPRGGRQGIDRTRHRQGRTGSARRLFPDRRRRRPRRRARRRPRRDQGHRRRRNRDSTPRCRANLPGIAHPPADGDRQAGRIAGRTAAVGRDGALPHRLDCARSRRPWSPRGVWGGAPANLDAIEFRLSMTAAAIAKDFRAGEIDLARDLLPMDLDEVVRDPATRRRLVESPKRNTYFIVFNCMTGLVSRHEAVRRALGGVVQARDLVWRTLGRFAEPATGLIPPGMFGHDPGRRERGLTREQAVELMRAAPAEVPLLLRAAVHPVIQDQYSSLLASLVARWAELASKCASARPRWRSSWKRGSRARDSTCSSDDGTRTTTTPTTSPTRSSTLAWATCARTFSSGDADRLLEDARSETRPAVREAHYRKLEHLLFETGAVVPLFHDIDYRVASAKVRGLKLRSTPPYVNYAELGKAESALPVVEPAHAGGGIVHVPVVGALRSLDPAPFDTIEKEAVANVFETLTHVAEGARIVPWLAASFSAEEGGRRYRFRLRDDVRFHDGRRLTARDVRYSFERLLQTSDSESRWFYAAIHGARPMLEGNAGDLVGFRIQSATEFTIDLEEPTAIFPALVSHGAASIVPEGSDPAAEAAVGTGSVPGQGFRSRPAPRARAPRGILAQRLPPK